MTASKSTTDCFDNNNISALNVQALLDKAKKEKNAGGDPQALLLSMSQALKEVLDQTDSGSNTTQDKIVYPDFQNSSATQDSSNTQGPSDATMQEEMGKLMGLLSELEGKIAEWGNKKTNLNSEVGSALLVELKANAAAAKTELDKARDAQNSSNFWSLFTKVAEVVVGAVAAAIALGCGQPELAVIIGVMTVMSVTGGMDAIVKGCSDLLLEIPGLSTEAANVIASALVVLATVVVTWGASTLAESSRVAAAADEVAEAGEEGAEEGVDGIANLPGDVAEAAVDAANEASETFTQRLSSFLGKVGSKLKENNPFSNLSKQVNLSIVTGSMTVANTNFGQYLALAILSSMKDGKDKESWETAISMIVNLMAALAGLGAGATLASTGTQVSNLSNLIKFLQGGLLIGGVTQATGLIGEAVAQGNLAAATATLGQTQAETTVLQALLNMNNAQMTADIKTLKGQLQAHSQELASLGADLVKAGAEVARVLQA